MNDKIVEYIRKNLKAGYRKEAIARALLRAGYDIRLINEQMKYALGSRPEEHFISNVKQELGSNSEKYFIIGLIAVFAIAISVMGLNYLFNLNIKEKEVASVNIAQDYGASLELLNKALIKNDGAICNEIGDDNLMEQCKNKFAVNETCDERCKNNKIFNLAIIKNNESLCIGITDEKIRQDCNNVFDNLFVNETEKICNEACKDKEFLNLALIKHNSSICLQIADSSLKNQCGQIFERGE